MVCRTRGSSLRRNRADESLSWSPERKPILGRGSPSPTAHHCRRGPPSPGIRPHRQRSPSPMGLSSPDPRDFSSSEEVEPSEATVLSSEVADQSDLEDGRGISSHVLELSPILEVDGVPEASGSSGSRSPTLSPTAAALLCQASGHVRGVDLVSSFSSSLLGDVDRGLRGGVVESGDALVVGGGVEDEADRDGQLVTLGDVPGILSPSIDAVRLPSLVSAGVVSSVVEQGVEEVQTSESSKSVRTSGILNGILTGAVQTSEFSTSGAAYPLPRLRDYVGICGPGLVSKEGRVLPEARGAMRSQPTDGLR
ncbi:hypothetical protein Dimus_036073 [Dionaea muscipula]